MEKELLIVTFERNRNYVKEIAESIECFEEVSFVDDDREYATGK